MSPARRLAAVAMAAAVVGCSSNGISTSAGPSGTASPTSQGGGAAASAPATPDERAAVLQQYDSFWQALAPASRLPAAQRRQRLSEVSADPELRSLLAGIARQRSLGHAFYGAAKPRPKLQQFLATQGLAVINDCQDASVAGVLDLRTHRHLTRGVQRNHAVVTMHQGADGVWRVTFVSFPKSPC